MCYIDGWLDQKNNRARIVERINGKRQFSEFPVKYMFYFEDENGSHRSIFGDKVSKFQTNDFGRFKIERASMRGRKIFESDVNVLFRILADNYRNTEVPDLHIALYDIEVDFDPKLGYATPENPYGIINAVTICLTWAKQTVTLAIKPHTITDDQAQTICDKFENVILCKDERELLLAFLDLIEESDVISGWNSAWFDLPYVIKRIEIVLGGDFTKRLCHWNQKPRSRMVNKFGRDQLTYDLIGRVHIDYLELYRKHSLQEHHTYRLDYIGLTEVNEQKLPYEGSLFDLYHYDFEKFISYNIQDVKILEKLHIKSAFIELAMQIAHQNSVLMKTTMGTVSLVEQAIINEAHDRGMVVHDKERKEISHKTVAGAYVAEPKVGIHEDIGAIDINSLYPSTIRALNMCAETIVGQVRLDQTEKYIEEKTKAGVTGSDAWHDVFSTFEYKHILNQDDVDITIDFEDGNTETRSARDWHQYIFLDDRPITISANGTLFRTDIEGIIPSILKKLYSERKGMQADKKKYAKLSKEETDPELRKKYEEKERFYDQRQYSKKILLNSIYGYLLNASAKFYDPRVGQSVTLTGRCISQFMGAKINQIITGTFDHVGEAIIYGDTDSQYFSAAPIFKDNPEYADFEWNRDNVIQLYDMIADEVNNSFLKFMCASFNCPTEQAELIKAGRELVASRGIFIKKKRYALLMYDYEGYRLDKDPEYKDKGGKIKAMGLDTKRTDTPKTIQDFLTDILQLILEGKSEKMVLSFISNFRKEFKDWEPWLKGTPKGVRGITEYTQKIKDTRGKVNLPGHVRASMNWNKLRKLNNDHVTLSIMDGSKIVVCRLKNNALNMTSIAYPVDEPHLPQWFKDLRFDEGGMEGALIDRKIENLIGVLKWDLKSTRKDTNFGLLFKSRKK